MESIQIRGADKMIEIKKYVYDSGMPGPRLLILGCIHGSEPCGRNAAMKVMESLDAGRIRLTSGAVTVVPVCNPPAFDIGARWLNVNLGRIIGRHEYMETYEFELANQIAAAIEECDYLLDIHSFSAPDGEPFVFQDYDDPVDAQLAQAFGLPVIKGWPALYGTDPYKKFGDAGFYAKSIGKIPVTVECGTNGTKSADAVALHTIMTTFYFLKMINEAAPAQTATKVYQMDKIVWADAPLKFSREWKNLDFVPAGTEIARYEDGRAMSFAQEFSIIMPKSNPQPGDELFYMAHLV
ncbi:succinylglutamate desuccinylase [Bacteroidia bacterium]|nr:succinylglutamate desuccinylase [Bacteroidia bacterium]